MSAIDDLRETVARLRAPDGCPWDIEQTHKSLCDCLIEECGELLDTIDREDFEHMREELGDLLLQVVMHAQMAEEEGRFNFDDAAREINEKLIRRHPHVFGDLSLEDSDAVLLKWEEIKAAEKKNGPEEDKSPFKHLPPQLPALLYAREIFKQIEKKSLPAEGILDRDAISSLSNGLTEATAGARLFALTAACRSAGIDPESALRRHALQVRESVTTRVEEERQQSEACRG
ncbi:MazG family protein [Rubellicoccus peritrichatus]|uniref:MazG family protein n=1 Tax=Rubellicoccus peritrichatus TaxID=3080537 RepID=A0AAQ3QS97_9BACT|nr:MazG family protein [Puniceicoccus sp. CR14]WOO40141.1 MazG family protein [Puniceicoccus sp. CR14]